MKNKIKVRKKIYPAVHNLPAGLASPKLREGKQAAGLVHEVVCSVEIRVSAMKRFDKLLLQSKYFFFLSFCQVKKGQMQEADKGKEQILY